MNLNKVELIGNLVANPIGQEVSDDKRVVHFTLATSRVTKSAKGESKRQADYHDLSAWGKLGEVVLKYLKKGDRVYVSGQLRTIGKSDKSGNRVKIVVDNLIMLGGSKQEKEQENNEDVVEEEVEIDKSGEG